jgi:cytochrome P450
MAVQGAPADLITGVAAPLPLAVLCHLVGIPLADREIFHPLVGVLFDFSGDLDTNRARTRGLTRYMADLVEQKRHRFPALALAEDPDGLSWKSGLAVRGLKELRVSW